jgi:hypothetical protein
MEKGKHISDVHDDIDLPYPDAKVAGRLCIGGPCRYVLKEGSGITANFLLENVAPNIQSQFPPLVARVWCYHFFGWFLKMPVIYHREGWTVSVKRSVKFLSFQTIKIQ